MAGTKESPRQKMIGMMYLVLTALLALQVSSALIYKFQALNTSLEKTVASSEAGNSQKQAGIAKLVEQRGKKPREVELGNRALEIRVKTQQMLSEIETIKKELVEKTGGYNEEGGYKGANEETEVEVIMIGANEKSGKAYALKKKLDEYVAFINQYAPEKFEGLARHASEEPSLKKNSDQRNKDYAHLNFGQTPMVAALAVLSETESKILNMEAALLAEIQKGISDDDFPVDKMMPLVKPQSEFVVAGTKYEAEMFMVATSSAMKPHMEFNNGAIPVDENGIGKLSFVASGGNYRPDGTVKKTWTGKIKIKKPNGEDSTYHVTHEYTVVKPVIQVQSASVQSLYKNCGNKLNISVPALGASYHPVFNVEGASLINGERPGSVTLVPTGAKVKVKVNNNGSFLGEENFGVKLIPMPSIEVKVNNQKVSPLEGITAGSARTMLIRAIPEKNFAEALPEDAVYFVSEATITLARGKKKVTDIKLTSGNNISLGAMAPEMKAGDRIIVEVTKVKRKNFRNEIEEVSGFGRYYETIILN